MKRLYFIRHGLSQANVEDIWGGQFETPLTEEGKLQAVRAGQKAQAEGLRFDVIITSPLSRASETARIIANETGYPEEHIEQDRVFLERSFGVLDGTPNARSFFDTHEYKDIDAVPGAETVEALQARAHQALRKLMDRPEEMILVVGHGAYGRAFRRAVNNQPYTDEFTGDWEEMYIPNAEIIQLI